MYDRAENLPICECDISIITAETRDASLTQGGLIVTPSQDGFLSSMNSAPHQLPPITPIMPITDDLWIWPVTHSRTLAPPKFWRPNTSGSLLSPLRASRREGQNQRSSPPRCSCDASALQSVSPYPKVLPDFSPFFEWLWRRGRG